MDSVAAATYDAKPTAAREARRFVRDTLTFWQLPGGDDLLADAELLTSELVTNAVVHAQTPVQVTCRTDRSSVEVSVLDWQPGRHIRSGQQRTTDAAGSTGRGLCMAAALASSWGVTYAQTAKVVWFRLQTDHPDPSADPPRVTAVADPAAAGTAQRGPRPVAAATARYDAELPPRRRQELRRHAAEPAPDVAEAGTTSVPSMRAAAGPNTCGCAAEQACAQAADSRTGIKTYSAAGNHLAGQSADIADAAADLPRRQPVADRAAPPLERARLTQVDRAGRGQISFLAEASDLLAGILDQAQAIALGAQLVVPRLAVWCAVLLPDASGHHSLAHVWHQDETRNDALRFLLSQVPPPRAEFPESQLQWSLTVPPGAELPPDAAELASDPVWCFPMWARGRSLGVLALGRPSGMLGWPTADLAADLARRVALALDNARLYSGQLRASHALQRSLLPPQLPVIPGLDIAAGYQAAGEGDEVGGDFYDLFQIAPDRWRFAIGDVCGKGMEAASVTGLTRHALRILAREGYDISAVAGRLNSIILDEGAEGQFLTLIHGEITAMPGLAAVSMVCAGHPPPLLLRPHAGIEVTARSQPLIGVIADAKFRADTCRIRAGDVLLCVTDGITERRSGDRLLDDGNGLHELLRDCSGLNAGAAVARIQREVVEYAPEPPADDIALLVFRGT